MTKKQRNWIVWATLLLAALNTCTVLAQGQEKIKVAVLELEVLNVAATVSPTIAESLRDYLRTNSQLEVMGRELMTQILQEKAPEMTSPFTEDDEILQVGRVIGVSKVIAGTVGKFGEVFDITLKLFDTETGESTRSSKSATGSLSDFMRTALREAAEELFPALPQTLDISGYIRTADGIGLPNVVIRTSDGQYSGVTDSQGFYRLTLPNGWSGTLRPNLADYRFAPPEHSYTDLSSALSEENFTATAVVVPIVPGPDGKKGGSKLLWVALGGAVVAGGIVAIVSGGGGDGGNGPPPPPPPVGLPRPPEPDNN